MIPTISCKEMDYNALNAACRDWGFFALTDHGIDPTVIEAALGASALFFQQPLEEKNKIRRSASNCWGYNDAELTKNKRDWKEVLDIGPAINEGPLKGAIPQWPSSPDVRSTLSLLADKMHQTALSLVNEIATSLNAQIELDEAFKNHSSFLRLNFYPPCANPTSDSSGFLPVDGELGISHHTDAGAVTILIQDGMPGLQIYHNGHWVDAKSERGTVLVNIGDIVQVWSNGYYQAPLHRVLASSQYSRFSIPYFLNPAYTYNYAPLSGSPRYRSINWGEFRAQRSAGDYADLGAEIQISDFLIGDERTTG
ncbi:MAG: 2OG-Fe(II) oxygenase family protein [Halioglobus sp.]